MDVIVIGAGLSGMVTADAILRARPALKVLVLEARSRIGGRTYTYPSKAGPIDLGATWVWPHHRRLLGLAKRVGVATCPQYEDGGSVYERAQGSISVFRGQSMGADRFEGGAQSLCDGLQSTMPEDTIRTDTAVKSVSVLEDSTGLRVVTAASEGEEGGAEELSAKVVVMAVPPRIIARNIEVADSKGQALLSASTLEAMRHTPTWMEDNAKVVMTFAKPFWRKMGLSGAGFSESGPARELHDASPEGKETGAIFAFVGGSNGGDEFRSGLSTEERRSRVHAQLSRMFGGESGSIPQPTDYLELDWSHEPHTCADPDAPGARGHPRYIERGPVADGRIVFAGSEHDAQDGGYMEGAVAAGERAARHALSMLE